VRQASPAGITRVFRLDLDTGRRTLLHEIKPATGTGLGPWFTITPDGSAYFYSYFGTEGDLFRVTGLK
jgi:hypothetical protein